MTLWLTEHCLSRNSLRSDMGTVWFNIHDTRGGLKLQALAGRTFMYGKYRLTVGPAEKRVGVPQCTRCWRFGHRSDMHVCPSHSRCCALCNGPHETEHHRILASCCRGNPKATPPVPPTPGSEPCPHKPRCVNCGGEHGANNSVCKYWKSRFDPKWIWNRYKDAKVSPAVWQFELAPNPLSTSVNVDTRRLHARSSQ